MTDTGTYEIWRQRRGLAPEHLFTLHDKRDVAIILQFFADKEATHGIRSTPSEFGGFTADLKVVDGSKQNFVSYWIEYGMTDEAIEHGDVMMFPSVEIGLAKAMIMGGLEGRSRRDAVAYGQPLERSEGE